MKIKFPDTNLDGNSPVMTLCGQGKDEGSFVGTVPMTLVPKNGVTRVSEKLVKVNSSTSVNKRGVRSGVVKVTMPYEALIADGNGGYVPDPSRSGGDLSVHIVVALPATAASDIRGTDATSSMYAKLQIGAVAHMLGILLQGLIATPLVENEDGGHTTMPASPTAVEVDEDSSQILVSEDGNLTLRAIGGVGFMPTFDGYQQNGGLQSGTLGKFPRAAGAVIERIARSLPALAGCEDIDVVHYQALVQNT